MDSDDYQLTDDDVAKIKASIASGTIPMPEWVNTIDDFDKWLEEVNHG